MNGEEPRRCSTCSWSPGAEISHDSWFGAWKLGRLKTLVGDLPIAGPIGQRNPALVRLRKEIDEPHPRGLYGGAD